MRQRGRKSAAQLAVAPVISIEPRPVAPDELDDESAQEWEQIIGRMPGGWLTREQHSLLVQFCRHIVAARRLAQLIADIEHGEGAFDEGRWLALRRAEAQQSGVLAALASKLRIAPSSRYGPRAAHTMAQRGHGARKPWEPSDD